MATIQKARSGNSGFSTATSSDLIELSSWADTASLSLRTSNTTLSPHTSTKSDLSDPLDLSTAYPSNSRAFTPTLHLQIQSPGHPLLAFPLPPKPSPIPIFAVDPKTGTVGQTLYLSLRHKRYSGSSVLVRAPSITSADSRTPLSTTTYRFGPFRHPRVRLASVVSTAAAAAEMKMLFDDDDDEEEEKAKEEEEEEDKQEEGGSSSPSSFDMEPRHPLCVTRTQKFSTRLGTFEWRYASRSERRRAAAGVGGGGGSLGVDGEVKSLLVMDRVVRIFTAAGVVGLGKGEEVRTPVAQFLRGDGLRTPGTRRSTAGNGGRLVIDFGVLGTAAEEEKEELTVLAITTCLVMLKKEVDRRRAMQFSAMAAGGSGGG